jgi:hypothetical protein
MAANSEPLTKAKKYTIVIRSYLFPKGVYVPLKAKIAPATFEPSEDFLGSLRWEQQREHVYKTQKIKIPINVVVGGLDRPYVFTNPTVSFISGKEDDETTFHECVIESKPDLSYSLLKEGAADRVGGKDVDDPWGKEDLWGNMRRAAAGAGTRGGRRKQKRHRRTLRKSRRHHKTK